MALNGTISGSIRGREYRIEWSAVQSVENNSSTITCVHKLINEPKFDLYISDRTNSCTVGSDTKSYTSADISTSGGSTITLGTTVHTVSHEPDGTKTVTIKGVFNIQATLSGSWVSNITASDTVTLDTIARASKPTVSASSVQMGSSVTIYTNRKADSLTHTLTYAFGGVTGTIATGVGASYKWTVPDLASKISGSTSGTCTITCKTYSGSTLVGTETVNLTLTIPDKSKPTVSASSVKMGNSVTIYTNRKSTGFTHAITYSFGGTTGTIATGVETSTTWTVPDLASKIAGSTSGTCTITCKTYTGSTLVGSDTVNLTLTVPDKSTPTVSAASVQMGNSVTIYTNRKSTSFTHTLTYSFGGSTGTIATGVTDSAAWTVPDLASKIAGSTSGTCTITCNTYTGSTLVGTDTVSLTLTVQGTSKPTVSATSVQMGNSVTIYTNRKSAGFTHSLTYSFGGVTGTIATGVGESYKWTVPDLASKIAGSTSGTCTITCKSYSGSALVGTDTVSLTLTIQGKSTPTVSASSVKMGNSVTIYTNRKSSGFTHKLTYTIGGSTGDIASNVTDSTTWKPPKDLAAYTGNKLSATCTITCSTYTGAKLVGSDTVTMTLTVPDATAPGVSATTVALGGSIKITTPRESSAYVHDLTYSMTAKGSSTVVATGTVASNVATEYSWTVPLSLAAKIPSSTEGTITVTCKTKFNGSTTEVGSKTKSFSVTVPNNTTTKPKVTMALSAVSDLPSAFSGIYVQGKSKVKVTYTASSDYSTIASYQTTMKRGNGTTNPYTSGYLVTEGANAITGRVTDARGYYTEVSQSVDVIAYGRPRVVPGNGQSNIVCTRCNSDGIIDPGGVYLLIQCGRNYHKVVSGGTQKNFCKLSYRWKADAQSESSYSSQATLLEKTATSDYVSVVLPNIVSSNTTAYNIQLIAEDDVGEKDTVTVTIPTAFAVFHVPKGGHGFTMGGYHNPEDVDVFRCNFDTKLNKSLSVAKGITGASMNGVYMKGLYLTSGSPSHFEIDTKMEVDTNGYKRTTVFMLGSNGGEELVMGGLWFKSSGSGFYTGSGSVTIEHLGSNKFKVKLGDSIWDHFVFLSANDVDINIKSDS